MKVLVIDIGGVKGWPKRARTGPIDVECFYPCPTSKN
jgi:hypothetical protein